MAISALVLSLVMSVLSPAAADADGPVTPIATDYVARITHLPAGIEAQVVDGYLSLWMQAPAADTVIVRDFRGAPWVRFNRAGVQVNLNSSEYYLSQVPFPAVPPRGLTPSTPPRWKSVSSGHAYMWREGRLHALATIALLPGQSYVGKWSIAMTVNGRPAAISGGLWHTDPPSRLWFWPVLVLLACAAAAWRVRSPTLDVRLTRLLMLSTLVLTAIGSAARYLHGRPGLAAGSVILLLVILALLGFVTRRVLQDRFGLPLVALTAIVALWTGLKAITSLTHAYVLLAFPAAIDRADTAALLGASISLALLGLRSWDHGPTGAQRRANEQEPPRERQPA